MAFRGAAVAASGGTTQTVTVTGIGIALGDIIVLALTYAFGVTPTWPSGFVVVPGTSTISDGGGSSFDVFYKVATSTEVAASTLAVTGTSFGAALNCRVYSGRNTSSTFTTVSAATNVGAAPFPVTFAISGLTATAGDDVVVFIGQDLTAGTTAATLSYTPDASYGNGNLANDTVDTNARWTAGSDKLNSSGTTGTIAGSIAVTSGVGPGQTPYFARVISIAAAPGGAIVADGHTAAGTTVATGTAGSGMLPVVVGQVIDVLFRAASATTQTCTCADSLGNIYTPVIVNHIDRTTTSTREFYQFQTTVTVPGTPVITATYGASAQMDIAATALSGLTLPAFNATQAVSHFQTAASIGGSPATDLQSSTNTPTLATVPTLLGVWGYCDGAGTPTTGTTFTSIGTAWSTLGGGTAQLRYEVQVYSSVAPVSGRFSPVPSQDAYTFLAVYNLPPGSGAPYSLSSDEYF